ncbi:hypothetical protein J6A31_04460 [bacterium]|nr:hypothetical protein [bacterium]
MPDLNLHEKRNNYRPEFYAKLQEIHSTYCPELRFGQMLVNFLSDGKDPFYWEDEKFIEVFEEWARGLK